MKQFTKCVVATLLTAAMCLGFAVPFQAAADSSTAITVTASDISSSGARRAIQNALNTAAYNAAADNPYVITVEAGNYTLDGCLYVFSYTTLKLTGVTLVRECNNNMIKVGSNDGVSSGVTGYYYKDIAIEDGTLDGNSDQGYTGTMVKAGHTENFTMTGVTLQNSLNSHIMEVAGTKGLTVTDCDFKNQVIDTGNGCYEALQLDILYSDHIKGYRSEDLPTQDVTVSDCTFSNVPRGVGSHTAILNEPMSNVTVTNCTFTEIGSAAVQFLYTKDLTITGNTITDAPRSIVVTMAGSGIFRPSTLANEGELTASASDSFAELGNQNIKISQNKITMGTKDNPYANEERIGIYALGESKKSLGDAPDGDYYINGVTITDNTVSNATGHGIRLITAKNSKVISNTVTYSSLTSYDRDYYGISVRSSSDNGVISGNTVSGAPTNGIYVYMASVSKISDNIISKSGNNGIYVNEGSAANSIEYNTVTDSEAIGIAVRGSTVTSVTCNTVQNSGQRGIGVFNAGVVDSVTYNTVASSGDYGIRYSSGSSGELIENNVITGSPVKDVHVDSTSKVTKIGENYDHAVVTQPTRATEAQSNELGDVDGDGTISISDATMIQKGIAKILELNSVQSTAADVDKDGSVTITDVTLIQKFIAKIIKSF